MVILRHLLHPESMLLESLGACIRRRERRLRLGELFHCVVEFTVCAGITARLVRAGGGELVAAETIRYQSIVSCCGCGYEELGDR